ncbi:MAG TPA: copper resistance protein NlpE N-terminal domain-containing protein [Burkholderiales bacterium]|nr:copper resistance protein NlpE N-terminal domain-containing protein [Burkholderiales bacterium]
MARRLVAALLLAGCAATELGTYEAVSPAASGGARHVRITLRQHGAAAVTSAYSDQSNRFFAEGTWQREGRIITVNLEKQAMVFQYAGELLLAKEWDRTLWGENGPGVLYRVNR